MPGTKYSSTSLILRMAVRAHLEYTRHNLNLKSISIRDLFPLRVPLDFRDKWGRQDQRYGCNNGTTKKGRGFTS